MLSVRFLEKTIEAPLTTQIKHNKATKGCITKALIFAKEPSRFHHLYKENRETIKKANISKRTGNKSQRYILKNSLCNKTESRINKVKAISKFMCINQIDKANIKIRAMISKTGINLLSLLCYIFPCIYTTYCVR